MINRSLRLRLDRLQRTLGASTFGSDGFGLVKGLGFRV